MKPCKDKKQLIVWSAAGVIEEAQQRQLTEHLRGCPGCREYFEQMLALKEDLEETFETSDLEPSANLHQRVTQRVLQQSRDSSVTRVISILLSWKRMWQGILTGAFALAVVGLLFAFKTAPDTKRSGEQPVANVSKLKALYVPGTSFAEYHQITEHSLDDLDAVLARQGKGFTHSKRYTVSSGAIFAAEN